ncbi:MAG TPA: adenosylmethionine decarboxylase [Vicinamibacterales bacterium]|nr:adenosylmethionine decarboxylase [Vicinamibacterales bacterium]
MAMSHALGELALAAGYNGSHGPASAKANQTVTAVSTASSEQKDYFVERDGVRYAGTHLLIDLWDATNLDNLQIVEDALRGAALAAGATILNVDLHHFEPNGGISGVVVLAESHISIHTWPERGFAALDIFMCGSCNPYKGIPVLKEHFRPEKVQLTEHKRGLVL